MKNKNKDITLFSVIMEAINYVFFEKNIVLRTIRVVIFLTCMFLYYLFISQK